MANPSSAFEAEDQTDEDFFNKLEDDDDFGVAGSVTEPDGISRGFSNLSIGDSIEAGSVAGEEDQQENGILQTSDPLDIGERAETVDPAKNIAEEGLAPSSSESEGRSEGSSGGLKGSGVKEVQWSAFSVDSEQFDLGGFGLHAESDFLTENLDTFGTLKADIDQQSNFVSSAADLGTNFSSSEQQDAALAYGTSHAQATDMNESQHWENLYPGWKFDSITGQWYQIDGYDATQSESYKNVADGNMEDTFQENVHGGSNVFVSDQRSEVSYFQQASQSMVGTVTMEYTENKVSNSNQASQGSIDYPPHMVFDPQYPEWYYDTNSQQWHSLESYHVAVQRTPDTVQEHSNASNGFTTTESNDFYNGGVQYEQNNVQGHNNQDGGQAWSIGKYVQPAGILNNQHIGNFHGSTGHATNYMDQQKGLNASAPFPDYGYGSTNGSTGLPSFVSAESLEQTSAGFSNNQHIGDIRGSTGHAANYGDQQEGLNGSMPFADHGYVSTNGSTGFPGFVPAENKEQTSVGFSNNQHIGDIRGSLGHAPNYGDQQKGLNGLMPFADQGYLTTNGSTGLPSFVPAESMYKYNQSKSEQSQHDHYVNQNSNDYFQQPFQSTSVPYSQFSNARSEGRSSAGRPPHALVTFGFGGKLIVMKDTSSFGTKLGYESQDTASRSVSVLSLLEVVTDKIANSGITTSSCDYFRALSQESFPGPLVGGSAATKDVNKWVDEKITNCQPSMPDFREGELLRLLFSLLKISCQHYGKLRSPFGSDPSLEEPDSPESAVTKLLASANKNSAHSREYGSYSQCIQSLPSEGQMQATAVEVQNLLVSGRRKEALHCAQAGQLWGPALVLAAQLGEKFYGDTVKQMAHRQLISGSPLRTLCLLIAGQPADVFSADSSTGNGLSSNAPPEAAKVLVNCMLDDWEENLAIITANRTKDDGLVILHLGDCLWRERGEIMAAHSCYLVAEAIFESYSDSARLCLIGADHWRCPRTYARPEAIQRTELYEYSKVLGNSQFILLSFQPYKLVYAYMLAEVGRVNDSLRYCQASIKLLKNSTRAPEVEMWKLLFSSLEDRLRTHQQGGFGSNLAPAKLVGKLITSIDKSIHRIMGAPPPPLPPMPQSGINRKESFSVIPKVPNSQSTMAMSSLVPSASGEAMNEWPDDSGWKSMHNRSVSEPDFSRSPKQDQMKDASSLDAQSKASISGGQSRFGRIGSQLLQKTMGWVSISRSGHQAKLGEQNKFYYDEKLKRWVEEGAAAPAEEPALQPPPTMASFQNSISSYSDSNFQTQSHVANGEFEIKSPPPSAFSSGVLNRSPSPNHFSARAGGGIRSRYVDTFNKGGGGALGKSFQSPSAPPLKPPSGAKFFVPATPPANPTGENILHEASADGEASAPMASASSFSSPPPTIHRFPSMDNITDSATTERRTPAQNGNGSFSSRSRAASWSGGTYTASPFTPPNPSNLHPGKGSLSDDLLHEVEL